MPEGTAVFRSGYPNRNDDDLMDALPRESPRSLRGARADGRRSPLRPGFIIELVRGSVMDPHITGFR